MTARSPGAPRPVLPRRHRSLPWLVGAALLASWPAGAAGAQATRGPQCRPIEGFTAALGRARVFLLGEIHGTEQSPAFVAEAACLALRAGNDVTVALEIFAAEQERIDRFLGSSGGATAKTELLAGPFWRLARQDGRESAAMLALLERLRTLAPGSTGPPRLRVIALDPGDPKLGGAARDQAMAERLADRLHVAPNDVVISLTGNFHNRLARAPWDASYEFMGAVVARLVPEAKIASLNVASTGGSAWMCEATAADCGPRALHGSAAGTGPFRVALFTALSADGYHGTFSVGDLTPSPPAVPGLPAAAKP
jgi:hypothetical protein